MLTTNCSNNYGPFQFPEKLIPLFIHNALAQKSLPLYGDGRQVRDWLYVRDHCVAIRQVLEEGKVGEVYNIGGHNEKTNLEIANMLCELLDEIRPGNGGESYKSLITLVKDRPGMTGVMPWTAPGCSGISAGERRKRLSRAFARPYYGTWKIRIG